MTKKSDNLQPDINFLYEMGSIRHMDRMWRRFHSRDFANLAEHHFRVFWTAMVIAQREGGVDTGKIAKMVLLHDIAESRTGDVDYLARQYVVRNEELAIKDMLGNTSLEKEFLEIWHEYDKRESLEAKIVKDADNLDVDMEMIEQASRGNSVAKYWRENHRETHVRVTLNTETAREIFDHLRNANPDEWHISGRNRMKDGDWKLKK